MNQEGHAGLGLAALLDELHPRDLHSIVSYLDGSTLQQLVSCLPRACAPHFLQAVRMTHFLRNFLLRADRSLYMPFYAEQTYHRIENELLRTLCGHSGNVLSSFLSSYEQLCGRLLIELQGFDQAQETVSDLRETLLDPQLPFPKLRKQSVGSHCNSAFQYYLVDKLLQAGQQEEPEEPFASLKEFLQQRQRCLPSANQHEPLYAAVMNEWFKIGVDNYEEFLVAGSTIHNLVVLLVALIDLLTDSSRFFLQAIRDPLHCFVEFNVRYCMLRNTILALEDKLSFLFRAYSSLCSAAGVEGGRELSVWHVTLSKWYLQVQRRHQNYFGMFFYLLRKVNLAAIEAEVNEHLDQDEAFIQLKNRLSLADLDLLQREQCFEFYSPLEQQFQADQTLYRQLIQEYMEYNIDISVNEYSVHWCGHSHHRLHVPYSHFEALFLPHFQHYLRQLIETAQQVVHPSLALDHTIFALLTQLDSDFLKPVTMRQLLRIVREEVVAVSGYQLFGQSLGKVEEMERYLLEEDRRVQIFNKLNSISSDPTVHHSIIIEHEDFTRMLKDSASTTASKPTASFLMEYHQQEQSMEEEHFIDHLLGHIQEGERIQEEP